MQTLQQRVERLERSCRRWRMGFLLTCITAGALAAEKPPVDASFAHLTVQSMTVRGQPDGAAVLIACDKNQASIRLASPQAAAAVSLVAGNDAASVFVSRNSNQAITSATMSADDQSGLIDVHSADGKNKEIEPQ
jgi:hypothetical protein